MESPTRRLLGLCCAAAQQIQAESESILAGASPCRPSASASAGIAGCGGALVSLLAQQASQVAQFHKAATRLGSTTTATPSGSTTPDDVEAAAGLLVLQRLDDIASLAHAKFYAFLYRDLPFCWRQLYTDASILKFSLLLLLRGPSCLRPGRAVVVARQGGRGHDAVAGEEEEGEEVEVGGDDSKDDEDDARLTELVKVLDLALILAGGAGQQRGRAWIDEAFELLQQACYPQQHLDHARDLSNAQDASLDSERPAKRRRRLEEQGEAPPPRQHADRLFSTHEPFTPPVQHAIQRAPSGMSLETFQTYLTTSQGQGAAGLGPQPLVLAGLLEDWPVRTTNPWNSADYLLSRTLGGRRLVPVEVGRSYVDEGWGQKLLPFRDFLSRYVDQTLSLSPSPSSASSRPEGEAPPALENNTNTNTNATGYLAQHQLFTQLPPLRADILVPDLCYTSPPPHPTDARQDQPELAAPLLNAWLGPPGTITPLHTDPYHNLLAQVVGRKYVRLYAPRDTPRLRPRGREGGVDMANTSALDVGVLEGWDRDGDDDDDDDAASGQAAAADPERAFRRIPFQDCILEPGDTLYIPIGWWHYVRGLSVSFSVSFWWN